MQIRFESDFQKKILYVSFAEEFVLGELSDLVEWRRQWTEVLKAWHSPYKALIDCTNLRLENQSSEMTAALERMFEFLKRFFLRKVVGWGYREDLGHQALPFEVVLTQDEGLDHIGVRERVARSSEDFRSLIHLDNHFEQQNVELSFTEPVILSSDKIAILRSKMTNNLMLWHSQWHLLIDCSNVQIPEEAWVDFEKMIRFLKGFFLHDVVGYSPTAKSQKFPFEVFRARHKAAAQVKVQTNTSGRDANCQSRKTQKDK